MAQGTLRRQPGAITIPPDFDTLSRGVHNLTDRSTTIPPAFVTSAVLATLARRVIEPENLISCKSGRRTSNVLSRLLLGIGCAATNSMRCQISDLSQCNNDRRISLHRLGVCMMTRGQPSPRHHILPSLCCDSNRRKRIRRFGASTTAISKQTRSPDSKTSSQSDDNATRGCLGSICCLGVY
ncbi:hypothetical protein B0H34DRAFT_729758 [Crassisporium funariophilum]|nr:hypothetical protein B0H34DRAFT_729758 [Crassisporium funariophilum]